MANLHAGGRRVLPLVALGVVLLATGRAVADDTTFERIIQTARHDLRSHERLTELCALGPRPAGAPALTRAAEWAEAALRDAGLDRVWREPVRVRAWRRGRERARVWAGTATWELPILGFGGSVPTAPGGIRAPLSVVRDFDELGARGDAVAGHVVLFDAPWEGYGKTVLYRVYGASAAARHGAVAVLVRSVTPVRDDTLHTGIMAYRPDAERIPAAAVSGADTTRLASAVRGDDDVSVEILMESEELHDVPAYNVLGEIRGRELPDEIVLLGAHLDSWDVGTGAHDDAAGCIVAMDALRILRALDLRPRRTLRLVLFASEELGPSAGRAYAERHIDELARHVVAFESDAGAFAPRGFSVEGPLDVLARVASLAEACAPLGADTVTSGYSGVDIHPMVEAGVPGIGQRMDERQYFHVHHSAADVAAAVDPAELAANVAAVAVLAFRLAEEGVPGAVTR